MVFSICMAVSEGFRLRIAINTFQPITPVGFCAANQYIILEFR